MPMSRRAALKAARQEMNTYVKGRRSERVAKCGGLHLFPDAIVSITSPTVGNVQAASSWQPLAGVRAQVVASGGVAGVSGLGRSMVMPGWQKRVDTRALVVLIDGPDWQWSVDMPAKVGMDRRVRTFVALINTTARQGDGQRLELG
jgi:hypothetical protein